MQCSACQRRLGCLGALAGMRSQVQTGCRVVSAGVSISARSNAAFEECERSCVRPCEHEISRVLAQVLTMQLVQKGVALERSPQSFTTFRCHYYPCFFEIIRSGCRRRRSDCSRVGGRLPSGVLRSLDLPALIPKDIAPVSEPHFLFLHLERLISMPFSLA